MPTIPMLTYLPRLKRGYPARHEKLDTKKQKLELEKKTHEEKFYNSKKYQSWLAEKNDFIENVQFKTLSKIETDLKKGMVTFFNPSKM